MYRNIHYFKDRIKVISGLKIFLDQLSIPLLVKNIIYEEEFHIINDLDIQIHTNTIFTNKNK